MASKRKFNVAPLSDDEENNSSELGGVNAFKKYKQTGNEENGQGSSRENLQEETEQPQQKLPMNEKSATNSIADQNVQSTRKAPVATNQVGKNFRETFAYLKNTDLFKLPPMPESKQAAAPKNSNSIIVNSRQRGNPILKQIRNIPWEYGDIVPDYEIGRTSCALFLSMRYHSLNPDYIHERLKKLGNMYDLRILLVLVDVVNCKPSLKELGRVAMYSNCTLILSWSPEEAGRYLETFKSYEHKPPDILQQRVESDHLSKMQDLLTTIKSVNKTDVITLMSTFGSLKNIVNANKQEMSDCPGLGSQKATRLYNAFNEPFKRAHSSSQPKEKSLTPKKVSKTIVDNNTALPSDCQLKKPESSQPDSNTKSKKAKKPELEISGDKETDNGRLDKPVCEENLAPANDDKPFDKSDIPKDKPGTSIGNRIKPNSSTNSEQSESLLDKSLSKSDAIQQFMKQKNTGGTKETQKVKPQNNQSKQSKTINSKQSTSAIMSRLRNDLKERTKKVMTSPITNTNAVSTGIQAINGRTSTKLTEEELNDVLADSDDEDDSEGEG